MISIINRIIKEKNDEKYIISNNTIHHGGFKCLFDDKGNYDYHEINELQITGLPEELQVKYRNVDTLRPLRLLKQRLTTAVCRIGIVLNGKLCPN